MEERAGSAWWQDVGDLENLDMEFPVPSFEGPNGEIQAAVVQDVMAAERHLKAISYYRHEASEIRAHAASHRFRIDAWEKSRLAAPEGRASWHEAGLLEYLKASGKKALKLAYGGFKFSTPGESLLITDEAAALEWARQEGFTRTKPAVEEIEKAAVKVWIKAHGEEPPGMSLERGEPTFKVEVA